MTSGFEQRAAQPAGVAQAQNSLEAQVAAGQLWMDAGVAEAAAARCGQAADQINQWLSDVRRLTTKLPFGANDDGDAAAVRFVQAGEEFVVTMVEARTVIEKMAATFRTAGRTATEADAASEQMMRGRSE
jgi:uncharacterized protein YukE